MVFEREFKKVEKLLKENAVSSYDELIELLDRNMTLSSEKSSKDAVIILGYSGNGKSTWAREFMKNNKGYEMISWDSAVKKVARGRTYREIPRDEIITAVDFDIENKREHNLILDGNYLNLPLRIATINALHTLDYDVYLADLTSQIDTTILFRIDDETNRQFNNPKYAGYSYEALKKAVARAIYAFKADEDRRSYFSDQVKRGVVGMGVRKVIGSQEFNMDIIKGDINNI